MLPVITAKQDIGNQEMSASATRRCSSQSLNSGKNGPVGPDTGLFPEQLM